MVYIGSIDTHILCDSVCPMNDLTCLWCDTENLRQAPKFFHLKMVDTLSAFLILLINATVSLVGVEKFMTSYVRVWVGRVFHHVQMVSIWK